MAVPTTTTKTATPKTASAAGVKKTAPKGGRAGKKNNARNAMAKMQAYFKAHRDEYKDLSFKEQQQELGKKWKASPENQIGRAHV